MQTMRKRDIAAVVTVVLFDAVLASLLPVGAYDVGLKLWQSEELPAVLLFRSLSVLIAVCSSLLCGSALIFCLKRHWAQAATIQRYAFVSLVCSLLVAFGRLLEPTEGGLSGLFAVIAAFLTLLLTALAGAAWLLLRGVAERHDG